MAPFIIGIIGGTTIIAGGTYFLEKIAEYIEQNNQTKSIYLLLIPDCRKINCQVGNIML